MTDILSRIACMFLAVAAAIVTILIGAAISTAIVWAMVVVAYHTLQFLNSLVS